MAFEAVMEPLAETSNKIWLEIIYCLKGQFDAIVDNSDNAVRRRLAFLKIWQSSLFFDHQNRVLATVKDECFFNSVIGHNQFVATICFILHCYMLYVI